MRARLILIPALVIVVGGTAWFLRPHSKGGSAGTGPAGSGSAQAERIVPVLTSKVEQRDVPLWLEGLGSVSAFYTVTVKPQVDGRIDKVLFTEGQAVKKGDLLVQIDPRTFQIQLQQAQAALARDTALANNGKLNLERFKTLRDQNLIAEQQLTDQQSTVAQASAQMQSDQAQVNSARLLLDYARVTSPIDGVTGVRLVDPGNVVHQSDANGLVVITQLDPITVLFTLPEDDLPAISEARNSGALLPVEAFSRDGSAKLADGTLSVIDNQINQATATIKLKAVFPNANHALWPNQFVKARLKLATRANAVVVPAAVVQHGPTGTFAYVVDAGDTVSMRPLEVSAIQGEFALIASGVKPGETVVVDGQAQIRPGSKVAPKDASTAAPARGAGSVTSGSGTAPSASVGGRRHPEAQK